MSDVKYTKCDIKRLELELIIKQQQAEVIIAECNLITFELENAKSVIQAENEPVTEEVAEEVETIDNTSYLNIEPIADNTNDVGNLFDNMTSITEENQVTNSSEVFLDLTDLTDAPKEKEQTTFSINQEAYNKLLD